MALDTLDNTAIELGLDIENYPGKWKQAKKMAAQMDKRDFQENELNAFEVSCRLFLELGGEKIKPSLEQTLREILDKLLGTSCLTNGAIPISQGFASIKLTGVVTEQNIRRVFRKYGVEQSLENSIAVESDSSRT